MKKKRSRRSLTKMPQQHPAISQRFRQIRKESGMSQEDFAKQLKITLSLVKQIETDRVTPNIFIIQQLRKKFNRSYDWIIDGKT